MLSKKNRLDKHDYKTVFNKGKTSHTPLLMVKSLLSEVPRFSVVVPKKVLKKAYQRNDLRRYVYNILKEQIDSAKNTSTIFILKRGFEESKKAELHAEVLEVLHKNN